MALADTRRSECAIHFRLLVILYAVLQKYEIILNANLMQQGNFINVFLARHISGIYAHHQEH